MAAIPIARHESEDIFSLEENQRVTKHELLQQIHEAQRAAGNISSETIKLLTDSPLPRSTPAQLLEQSPVTENIIQKALKNAKAFIEYNTPDE